MSTVVTTEDGRYAGRFDWTKADRWSDKDPVSGNGSGGTGRGEAVMRTAGGRWVLESWTNWQGERNTYRWITPEQAQEWLLLNGEHRAVGQYFGDQPGEEDRRAGRPGIGGAVHVRLGDLLPAVDEFAVRAGLNRAAAVRRLAGFGLSVVTLTPGMKPVVVECNVVTGRIEISTEDWDDDDARWNFVADPFMTGANALGTTLDPWGEDELGMDRATEAVRDLGYTVSEWTETYGETWQAIITGRA